MINKSSLLFLTFCLVQVSSQSHISFECEQIDQHRSKILAKSENFTDCKVKNVLQVSDVEKIIVKTAPNGVWEDEISNSLEIGAITFVNSLMMKIPTKAFEKFKNLRTFCACDVQLRMIIRDDFADAQKLTDLKLRRNLISKLQDGIFSGLKKLRKLDLSENLIRTIGEGTFVGCSDDLEKVDLSLNKLKELDFASLISLAHAKKRPIGLSLNSNEIKHVKENHHVSHLVFESLNLKDNFLHHFSCPNMKIGELHLENNLIESISFDNCSVEYMKVSRNKLKWLHIHEDMKGLIAVENQIESFIVMGNSKMYHLELTKNGKIEQVFPTLKSMDHMQYLNLSNTIIGTLHEDTFVRMTELKYLFLKSSRIEIIPFGIFNNNKQLVTLDLSDNDLKSVDFHMFTGLDELKTLNLSGNKLSQIEGIEKIKTVLPELKQIGISGNNWKCINLSRMIRTLSQLGISIFDDKMTEKVKEQSILGVECY